MSRDVPDQRDDVALLRRRVDEEGILLVHDRELPSATRVLTGGPVQGSWWSHPEANRIYAALEAVDGESTTVKLVAGKDTLVAPRLCAALLGAVAARQAWQLDGLDGAALELLNDVEAATAIEALVTAPGQRAAGRRLEQRLLVHATGVHTHEGHHVRALQSWRRWAERRGLTPDDADEASGGRRVAQSRAVFEAIVDHWLRLMPTARRASLLPWPTAQR